MAQPPSRLPKVLLHDHLDGGLRPETVLELARATGYGALPGSDAESLRRWFHQDGAGSLERYLEAFGHTTAVMQTREALDRVAYEAGMDLAADGVLYAEIRFAPSLHQHCGLDGPQIIEAVLDGLRRAEQETSIVTRVIVVALRQDDGSAEAARLATAYANRGVVGFDLAGPEAGHPASGHGDSCRLARTGGLHLTIHAGEGDGPTSVADALDSCGAQRIGHGVRIVEDMEIRDGTVAAMGPLAERVHRMGIPLEVCQSSNLNTGLFRSHAEHPIGRLHRAGFAVTLNTDNRLMSNTTMTREFELAAEYHGFDAEDFRAVTLRAVDAAFCDDHTRSLIRERVEAGYRVG